MIARIVRALVLTWLLLVVCLTAYGIGFAAHSLGYGPSQLREIPAGVLHPTAQEPPEFEVFWEAWGHVGRDFYGELPDSTALSYGAIRGMLRALDDPYTFFIEPSDHEIEEDHLEGRHGGIGAEYVMADGYLVVVAVLEDSPAEQADIRTGDIIVSVDGTDIMGLSQNEAIMLIRGKDVGSVVTLIIVREGEPQHLTVAAKREQIDVPSVVWERKDDDVGYLRISFFGTRTSDELRSALQELKAQGARKLVLDLRDNPGGMVTAAVDVASEFIDTGVIFYERDKEGNDKVFNARRGGAAIDMPMAVLVNGGTASASEIVAGAIQDHGRAPLMGEQTFGKGSLQSIHELSDNSGVHVTIAHWLTPDRHEIQDAGLLPDTEVMAAAEGSNGPDDPQLAAVLNYLSSVKVSRAPQAVM